MCKELVNFGVVCSEFVDAVMYRESVSLVV